MRQPNPNLCPKNAQAAWKKSSSTSTQVTVQCGLITPMYGGGVTAGVVDRNMPIRASALRGQLRFWWRLLNSTTYPNPNNLFKAESALWGGISSSGPQASQVTLNVKANPVSPQDLISSRGNNNRIRNEFDYVLILEQNDNPKLLNAGYTFELVLSFKSTITKPQQDQVIEALRWWASFGGVGARTRRGLGAVKATGSNLNPVPQQEVTSKNGVMVLHNPGNNAIQAWRYAIDKLKDFRQGRGIGRNHGTGNRPGRSRWPEPDTIRAIPGYSSKKHPPVHPVTGYPRAAFGLPIVFQNDPTGTLEPDIGDGDRMASPLILRPYFDGTQYHSLALLLPGWEDCVSVSVRFDQNPLGEAWPTNPTNRQTQSAQVRPMNGRGDNALSAFLAYF